MKHIFGFSGGIDSQAAMRWGLNRFPAEDVIATNSPAGNWEDPLTLAYIENYSITIHPIEVCKSVVDDMWETPGFVEVFKAKPGNEWASFLYSGMELSFELMCIIKGRAPSRMAQFCTEKLKLIPQRRWISQQFGVGGPFEGVDYVRYAGVRREESESRKNTPIESWDDWYDCKLVAPIADWTKQMCFDFVKAHGEPINPLYSMGFNRVGCAPCINSGREDLVMWYLKRPAMIDKVRALEQKTGRTFFAPMVPGLPMNNIDEVMDWALSLKRGGHKDQPAFPILLERPSCESKYGLCE